MALNVIFIALILLYTLVSKRLDRTKLTAPIVFAGAGMLVLLVLPSLREQQGNIEVFMKVAEVGLSASMSIQEKIPGRNIEESSVSLAVVAPYKPAPHLRLVVG